MDCIIRYCHANFYNATILKCGCKWLGYSTEDYLHITINTFNMSNTAKPLGNFAGHWKCPIRYQ